MISFFLLVSILGLATSQTIRVANQTIRPPQDMMEYYPYGNSTFAASTTGAPFTFKATLTPKHNVSVMLLTSSVYNNFKNSCLVPRSAGILKGEVTCVNNWLNTNANRISTVFNSEETSSISQTGTVGGTSLKNGFQWVLSDFSIDPPRNTRWSNVRTTIQGRPFNLNVSVPMLGWTTNVYAAQAITSNTSTWTKTTFTFTFSSTAGKVLYGLYSDDTWKKVAGVCRAWTRSPQVVLQTSLENCFMESIWNLALVKGEIYDGTNTLQYTSDTPLNGGRWLLMNFWDFDGIKLTSATSTWT
jgi:hypothetical protein